MKGLCISLVLYASALASIVVVAAQINGASWSDPVDDYIDVDAFLTSERARFDVWAVGMCMDTTVGELGAYNDFHTYIAWTGWSARAWSERRAKK